MEEGWGEGCKLPLAKMYLVFCVSSTYEITLGELGCAFGCTFVVFAADTNSPGELEKSSLFLL